MIFVIKNIVRNNAFIEYNASQFILFINNYFAYIITFLIDFVRLKYFVIKRVFDNFDVELDVIEIQLI